MLTTVQAFNIVNINDSKEMQKLTEAARNDNEIMKTLTQAAVGGEFLSPLKIVMDSLH